MAEFYDGPGRARKECPACNKYVHARVAICPCGHTFGAKVKVEKPQVVKTPESVIPPSHKVRTERTNVAGDFVYYAKHLDTGITGAKYIQVPAGKCPVDIKHFTEEGIKAWADKLAELSAEKNEHLSKEAIEYYSRRQYNYPLDKVKEELIKKVIGL